MVHFASRARQEADPTSACLKQHSIATPGSAFSVEADLSTLLVLHLMVTKEQVCIVSSLYARLLFELMQCPFRNMLSTKATTSAKVRIDSLERHCGYWTVSNIQRSQNPMLWFDGLADRSPSVDGIC